MYNSKRICLISPSLKCGGAERVMSELANEFCEEHEVYFILLSNLENFYTLKSSVHIIKPTFNDSKNRYKYALKLLPYLRSSIKDINPDTILSFGRAYNPFVLFATLGLNYPVYVSDRGNPHYNSGLLNEFLRKILYKKATGIISQTKYSADIVSKKIGHTNIKIIPNPIREIKKYDVPRVNNKIIFVGRLVINKGVNFLLDAVSKLQAENWSVQIIGDGPEMKNLKNQAIDLGIADKIDFTGQQPDVDLYLSSAEIFVFPSLSEGFPNGLAEAMAHGLACISFDCITGPSELITDSDNGYLIKIGDIQTLIEKLNILLQNNDIKNKIGNEALKISNEFKLSKIAELYLSFILEKNRYRL